MAPKIVDKNKKKREILRSALGVFGQRGIHDFKMIQIAEAAGVGKGTLYEYFPSKADLVIGSFELLFEDFEVHMEERMAQFSKPLDQVREYFLAGIGFFAKQKRRLDVLFDFYAAGLPRRDGTPLLKNMAGGYGQAIGYLASIIQRGVDDGSFRPVDAQVAARTLLATLDGLLFQSALGITALNELGLPEKTCDVFMGGLLK